MAPRQLRVGVVGLGYFSRFHLDAWAAHPAVKLTRVCDIDLSRRAWARATYEVETDDAPAVMAASDAEVIDIITPPAAHANLIKTLAAPGRVLVCQKPFCTSLAEAEAVVIAAEAAGARLVIHENFRFQPWHRTAKRFIDDGQLGDIFESVFYLRPGDGRGPHAYLDRQPAFQTMPRLLIYETGVHFVDLFRWLFGPIKDVYADLRRLNPAIRGEDAGQVMFTHSSGVRTTFNGNRLSDHISDDTRRTMGIMVTEGTGGSLRLYGTGNLSHRRFGAFDWTDLPTVTPVDRASFGGGCVAALIDHVVASCLTGAPFENEARDYLPVVRVTEAIYQSHETGQRLAVDG